MSRGLVFQFWSLIFSVISELNCVQSLFYKACIQTQANLTKECKLLVWKQLRFGLKLLKTQNNFFF